MVREGTRKSLAPSRLLRVNIGVSTSMKPSDSRKRRAEEMSLERNLRLAFISLRLRSR